MPRKHTKTADLPAVLEEFLKSYTPESEEILHVLVAVSGGADSMALLAAAQVCAKSGKLKLTAAHLIHRPEEEEPRRRAQRVEAFCKTGDIPLIMGEMAGAEAAGFSPEEWMRRERYLFLEKKAENQGCDYILTAHHADDQAETVLFRVLSGTGLRGLRGIPQQRDRILRPFLSLKKSVLLDYCRDHRIPYGEDPSNRDLKAPRNFIRHKLIPLIEDKLNPDVSGSLNRLGLWAAEAELVVEQGTEECCKKSLLNFQKGKIILDLNSILPYFTLIQKYAIRRALSRLAGDEVNLSAEEMDRIADFLKHSRTGSELEFGGGLKITRSRRQLVLTIGSPEELNCPVDPGRKRIIPELSLVLEWDRPTGESRRTGDGLVADLDLGNDSRGLMLRYAREGDRFHPLGAPGEKRLFRFLTDRKVPRCEKRTTPVLVRDDEILWVVGHRVAEAARVRNMGQHTWRLKLMPLEGGERRR